MIALEVGGWLAASAGVVAAAVARRALAGRMETHRPRVPRTARTADCGAGWGSRVGAAQRRCSPPTASARSTSSSVAPRLCSTTSTRCGRGEHGRACPNRSTSSSLVSDCDRGVAPDRGRATVLSCERPGRAMRAPVWGDRLRLAQVTGNLIANAIEHGGGVVEVHGHGDRYAGTRRGGRPWARAAGAGRRARPAAARRGRGRRGRGLAIAAAIAADQGGRLAVAPSMRGARVVLELPAGRAATEKGPGDGRRRRA